MQARTGNQEVRDLAYDIINTRANQRGMLLGLVEAWELPVASGQEPMAWMDHAMYYEPRDGSLMPGMATDTEIEELRGAEGTEAEVLSLPLMTEHHQGGADMAQGAADLAEDPVIVRLAESMVRGQQSEMQLMADMLEDRDAGMPDGTADTMPDMQH